MIETFTRLFKFFNQMLFKFFNVFVCSVRLDKDGREVLARAKQPSLLCHSDAIKFNTIWTQAEIMEEKVALKNVDPGNPNWEFLSMIREYQEQVSML